MRGRNPENPSDRTAGSPTEQRLEPKTDGKTNCLTSVAKDNLIMTKNYIQDNSNGGFSQSNRYYYDETKAPTLGTGNAMKSPNIITDQRLRRLTPTECARLQTIPDWYKWNCSDTQQYKMLGNGWTVEVIKHILSFGNFKINKYEQINF